MSLIIKHKTQSTAPNDPGSEISSAAWNEEHEIIGDIDANSVQGLTAAELQGQRGPAGQDGDPGAKGDKGETGDQFISNQWTNSTRPVDPGMNIVGYNMEEKRPEIYVQAEGKWYYLWQGIISALPPTSPAIFSENFEAGWLHEGQFNQVYAEVFESGWFMNNQFNLLGTDSFGTGWFIDGVFNKLFAEDFEGPW